MALVTSRGVDLACPVAAEIDRPRVLPFSSRVFSPRLCPLIVEPPANRRALLRYATPAESQKYKETATRDTRDKSIGVVALIGPIQAGPIIQFTFACARR